MKKAQKILRSKRSLDRHLASEPSLANSRGRSYTVKSSGHISSNSSLFRSGNHSLSLNRSQKRVEDQSDELVKIASKSLDMFTSVSEALAYLNGLKFDEGKTTAQEMIAKGRKRTVESRIDELRYGVNS